MPGSAPLIQQKIASGMLGGLPKQSPTSVFVLSYNRGELRTFTRAPSMSERYGSKQCFVVDAATRYTDGKLSIPSSGDVYFFHVQFNAVWYVSDPTAIVRRDISDGDGIVTGLVRDTMWNIGRRYAAGDAEGLEAETRNMLRSPYQLEEGITLTGLTVRTRLDPRRASATAELHADTHQGQLEQQRFARVKGRITDEHSVMLDHLAKHPEDTLNVLTMMANDRSQSEANRLALLQRFVEQGLIQEGDLSGMITQMVGAPASAIGGSADPGVIASIPPTYAGTVPVAQIAAIPPQAAQTPDDAATVPDQRESQDQLPPAGVTPDGVQGWRRVGQGRTSQG